jgi:hypothetical protein
MFFRGDQKRRKQNINASYKFDNFTNNNKILYLVVGKINGFFSCSLLDIRCQRAEKQDLINVKTDFRQRAHFSDVKGKVSRDFRPRNLSQG